MLDRDQLLHFAEHGWVLLERVFPPARCRDWCRALDAIAAWQRPGEGSSEEMTVVDNPITVDAGLREWFAEPRLLDANRQVLGASLRFQGANAHIKRPHPRRADIAAAERLPAHHGWHRGLRPKWCNVPDDGDPALLNAAFLNNITYLTDLDSPDDGATAVLDGSHRAEGEAAALVDRFGVRYIAPPAGSVLLFTESLVHSGTPVLSERTRYTLYIGFVPPWFACWPGMDVPRDQVEGIADPVMRRLLAAPHYGGQHAEAVPGEAPRAPA